MKDSYIPKVSVIIPVWNPGPGISHCIESLRNQALEEIEMIFVDDCGTDDSMDEVCAAAREDSRIRIIENEENIGAGLSRNRGIDAAQGEYLSFIDPDDYVAPDFYELLYREACQQSSDIVKGSLVRVKEDGSFEVNRHINQLIREGLESNKPLFSTFMYTHQSAIYRRDLILAEKARYGTSARGEDLTFLLQVCSCAKSFSMIDEACYFICYRPDSSTQTTSAVKLDGVLQFVHEMLDYVLAKLPDDASTQEYLAFHFRKAIEETERYRSNPDMQQALADYVRGLRREYLRLPCKEQLSKQYLPLRYLQDYSAALPLKPSYSVWVSEILPIRHVQLVEQWVDFLLAKPEETETCWNELNQIISKANQAVNRETHSSYSDEEKEQATRLLRQQIKRLPKSLRRRLKPSGIARSAKTKIATVLPQPIKRVIKGIGRTTATGTFGASRRDRGGDPGPKRDRKETACSARSREELR